MITGDERHDMVYGYGNKGVIIFDLDGTLTDNSQRLHYIEGEVKDWDKYTLECVNDKPRHDIIDLYKKHLDEGYDLVILTGRSRKVEKETLDWLLDNDVLNFKALYMRPNNDWSKDVIFKGSVVMSLLDSGLNVVKAYDDLDHNIDLVNSLGIKGIKV